MGLNLRKIRDAAFAQINPFDGGKTANTVWNNTPVGYKDQSQTIRPTGLASRNGTIYIDQQARQASQARPQQSFIPGNQKKPSGFMGALNAAIDSPLSPVSVGKEVFLGNGPLGYLGKATSTGPLAKPTQGIRDTLFDANTAKDIAKRNQAELAKAQMAKANGQVYTPKLNQTYMEQQASLGRRGRNNFGDQMVGGFAENLNTVGAKLYETPETLRGTVAASTGNQEALRMSLERQKKNAQMLYGKNSGGLLNTGTIYDSPEQTMNLSAGDTAKRVFGGQLEAASMVVGGGALPSIAKSGLKGLASYGGKTFASGAMGLGGNEMSTNPNASAMDIVKQSALGGVFGLGLGVAGDAAVKGVGMGVKAIKPKVELTKVNQQGSIDPAQAFKNIRDKLNGSALDTTVKPATPENVYGVNALEKLGKKLKMNQGGGAKAGDIIPDKFLKDDTPPINKQTNTANSTPAKTTVEVDSLYDGGKSSKDGSDLYGTPDGYKYTVEIPSQQNIETYRAKKAERNAKGYGYVSSKSDIVVKLDGEEVNRITYDKAVEKYGTTDPEKLANLAANQGVEPATPKPVVKAAPPTPKTEGAGKEIKTRTIRTADGKNEYVAQLGDTVKDRVGRSTGFKATSTSPQFKTEGEMNAWVKKNIELPPVKTEGVAPKSAPDNLDTLKTNLDKTRQELAPIDKRLTAEFTNKSKNMTEEQKSVLFKEYQAKYEKETASIKKQQADIESSINNYKKSELPDNTTASEVGRLIKESHSKNTFDPKNTGYFINLSKDNIKNITPLKGIDDYGDRMFVDTDAGISTVSIQDWSESGQGFRVSNGNGNEIARFNTDAEARDFARKALTVENEAARQGKRVILSGSRVENRTKSTPVSAPIEKTPTVKIAEPAPKPVVKAAQHTKPNVVKSVKPEKPVVEPIDSHGTTLATEIKRGLSDKDQVILDELRNIEKQTGQKGLVDKFMYNSNMQRGSNATANVELRTSKNINEAIGGLSKKEYKAFSDYANARTELSTADNVVATSRPKADLEATVAAGDGAYGARFEALNKHYKGLASEAEKSGLISKETAALYKKNNDYVRLQKDMGDLVNQGGRGGNSFSIGSTVMGQKRKGSSRANLNAGEVTAEYTQQVYKEIARNRTASHLASSLENAGLATKLDDAAAARNQNVMKVMKKGKPEYYQVSADIKEAVDNINPYHMNVVMQILATPGRIVRAGITGLNPVFIARNLLKDQVGSAINSEHIMSTHNPASFFRGFFNATADSVGASNNPLYKDFLKHYGDQTSFDLTRNVKESGQVINRIRGGKAIGVGQALKSPIRTLENFASITEKSTRFQNYVGEYKKAIAQGLSKDAASEKAAIAAWQNSVDFSRAGTWGRVINTVVPYWNPSTQGVRQMGRTFTKHPVKSGLTATALVGVPIATATAWNLSNPETAAIYNNIPEYEKDNNLVLVPPGTTQNKDGSYDIIKIPLPPGYKDAFMPIRRVMESYYGKKPIEGAKIAQDILQVVGGPVNFQTKGAFIGSFIPQAAKPAVQWATNTDLFSGRKTEPEYVQNATDAQGNPIPNGDKAFKYTSGTASIVGKKTNSSPMKIEKLVKDIGGTVGLNLLNASDQALAKAGVINKEQVGGLSVGEGFVRSFGKAQGIDNSNKTAGAKYYDTINKVQNEAKLTVAEKNAWDTLHPGKKNFLGETVYENDSTYNPAARLDAYNRFPKVFEVDKKIDAEGRKNGKPGNPIYDLESWQVKKVLEKENLPPGAKDPELSNLYSKDWYADYSTNKSKYFTAIGESQKKDLADAKASGDTAKASSIQASMDKYNNSSNKYPVTPPELQKTMDYYSSLPKGTGARSAWIKSNPGQWKMMQDQFAAIDNWQNIARGERGLDATEGAVGDAAGYGDGSSGYSKYGYSRSGGSGGGGSGDGLASEYDNPYKYAVSIKAKGSSKATVKLGGKIAKRGVTAKATSKPKVTIKKSTA